MKGNKKVIFLTYIPSPYRVDFFNELNKYCDLLVVYYYSSMPNAPWKESEKKQLYDKIVLFDNTPQYKGIIKLLKLIFANRKEIIVVGGYSKLAELVAIFFMKFTGIKFVLNSDGGFITPGFMKTILKKTLIKSADYWLSSGSNTSNSLIYYGAKKSFIYEYHFTTLLKNEVLEKPIENDALFLLRNKYNLKKEILYLIYVGQLIHRKGVDTLLEAMTKLYNKNIELLIIGDGTDYKDLYNYSIINELHHKVHFLGKLQKHEVLDYLKLSDVFVFPSREDIWGLVLNEAIAYGLPLISTKQVGSSFDLISEDENGYMIDSNNANDLALVLNKLLLKDLFVMRLKSFEIAQKYNIEVMVKDHMVLFTHLFKEQY